MHYSLLSRFQGCLWGSIIGAALGNNIELEAELRIAQYELPSWLAVSYQHIEASIASQEFPPRISESQLAEASNLGSDRLCLLLLPLIIFSADNLTLLAKTVWECNSYLNAKEEELEDALIWGSIIALICREKLNINDFIPRILTVVEVQQNSLIEQLEIVRSALKSSQTPDRVIKKLSSLGNPSQTSLALSLYFWWFTPENYDLAVIRAIKTKHRTSYTAALTGALAGVSNGLTGIPGNWRVRAESNSANQQVKILATRLFQLWSGAYLTSSKILLDKQSQQRDLINSVAAIGTIQKRSQLNIISQREY